MKKTTSILYVNFSPYSNAGNILDFLLTKFPLVIMFCFNFYKLGPEQDPSMITVYKNKTVVYKFPLYQTPTPKELVFVLLPIRSIVLFIQLFLHTYRLQKKYGTFDYFFTVNAFSAWCGNVLRKFGLVRQTIFWVWDYYPPKHADPMVRFMRWLYWQFDKPATLQSNKVFFLNRRLAELRKKIGILSVEIPTETIGIATNPQPLTKKHIHTNVRLVFFGVIKKSHGLDLILKAEEELRDNFKNIQIEIIGGGPDEEYYKSKAANSGVNFIFHGYIKEEHDIDALIRSCDIGLAPYTNDESNVSQFTDPSKIKRYLVNGLPVITTNVFEFSEVIEQRKAGIIIPYETKPLIKAIKDIKIQYGMYQKNATKLASEYSYKNIYEAFFKS